MSKMRAAFIAALAGSAVAAACSDNTPPISAPFAALNAASGTWTSTIWQPTDSGLQYVGARSGLYESAVDGKAIIDSGAEVHLDASAIALGKERVETETVLARLTANVTQLSAIRQGGRVPNYRPQLRSSQITKLGTKDGKTYALEQTLDGRSIGAPPSATILTVDGQPIAVRQSRFRKVRGRWQTTHSSTSVIDTTARTTLVVETDFGVDASRGLAVMDRMKSGFTVAGDALAAFVLPATLHAATMDDDALPCQTELNDQLKAAAAWTTAAGLLAAAAATCPVTGVSCAAIPWLAATLYIADAALGIAIGNYAACMVNYNRAKNTPNTASSGGNSGSSETCVTVDWYRSTDGGHSWSYVDSTTACGSDEIYMI